MLLRKIRSYVIRKSQPQISVIMPVFNAEAFVRSAITSVQDQTFENIEIICVDDCSTDGSLDILHDSQSHDPRIKVVQSLQRMGAGQARNRGIEVARGSYVRFMDADDLLPHSSLDTLHDLALRSNVKLVRGAVFTFADFGASDARPLDVPPKKNNCAFSDEPIFWKPWWFQSYLIARSLLIEGNIRFPDLSDGEDPVFLANVLCHASFLSSTDEVVYKYRSHSGQRRNNVAYMEHLALVREIFLRHQPHVWFDGYGRFAQDTDIPSRLQSATHEEALMMVVRIKELMNLASQGDPRSV
jgi:glycosyltransferase involved in cell wall biosynthesis